MQFIVLHSHLELGHFFVCFLAKKLMILFIPFLSTAASCFSARDKILYKNNSVI